MIAVSPSILNLTRLAARVGFADWLARAIGFVRAIGPYAAIEIILPGGTVLALLFWLYRRYQRGEPLLAVFALERGSVTPPRSLLPSHHSTLPSPLTSTSPGFSMTDITTRRLCARPSGVSLLSTGIDSP